MPRHPHLIVPFEAETRRFTSTRSARQNFATPPRNRAEHARDLIRSYEQATAAAGQREAVGNAFYQITDLTLTFESDPGFPLAFESLDLPASNINLLSVSKDAEGRTLATVRVPQDKIALLLGKLEAYRDNDPARPLAEGEKRKRDNRKLAESISQIRRATLREFWTDPPEDFPAQDEVITWEVWLRREPDAEEEQQTEAVLRNAQDDFGYEVVSDTLDFVDRSVLLVRATATQLAAGASILGIIAEVRKAKRTAGFFDALPAADQHGHIDGLNGRVQAPALDLPVVGLLDTGVNRGHPLLATLVPDANLHTYKQDWGVHDTGPHGTGMAGLALYGDLTPLLGGNGAVELTHRLESLKLINEDDEHDEHLYGAVTIEGVSRLEVTPDPRRLFCMAITTDGKDRGRPTSWSAAIDNLAAGVINDTKRLIIISAGNTTDPANYPADNQTSSVQDPAQAWNALTIGGTTDKVIIDGQVNPGYTPLAEQGDLAPASTTSLVWPTSPRWPFKPDIVVEACNMGRAANAGPLYLPELCVLTTSDTFLAGQSPLMTFQETSAATAIAANLAGKLWARYPALTPEAVRALMVHAARWSPAMLRRCSPGGALNVTHLLRTFGHGAPYENVLLTSADNALTLISQGTMCPFIKEDGTVKTKDIKIHALPWPAAVLQELPLNTEVSLRVTLSYFVEPSPGERGWDKKYGYASHGLRFAVQRPTETPAQFIARINAYGRDENYDADAHQGDAGSWFLGTNTPSNGCIHSNIWTGTAAQLANRSHVAVYPTMGWWKTRTSEERYDRDVDYALVVSLVVPDIETDIYTPVAQLIEAEAAVEVEIPANPG